MKIMKSRTFAVATFAILLSSSVTTAAHATYIGCIGESPGGNFGGHLMGCIQRIKEATGSETMDTFSGCNGTGRITAAMESQAWKAFCSDKGMFLKKYDPLYDRPGDACGYVVDRITCGRH